MPCAHSRQRRQRQRGSTCRQHPLLLAPHPAPVRPRCLADALVEQCLPVVGTVDGQRLHVVLHVQQAACRPVVSGGVPRRPARAPPQPRTRLALVHHLVQRVGLAGAGALLAERDVAGAEQLALFQRRFWRVSALRREGACARRGKASLHVPLRFGEVKSCRLARAARPVVLAGASRLLLAATSSPRSAWRAASCCWVANAMEAHARTSRGAARGAVLRSEEAREGITGVTQAQRICAMKRGRARTRARAAAGGGAQASESSSAPAHIAIWYNTRRRTSRRGGSGRQVMSLPVRLSRRSEPDSCQR